MNIHRTDNPSAGQRMENVQAETVARQASILELHARTAQPKYRQCATRSSEDIHSVDEANHCRLVRSPYLVRVRKILNCD